MDDKDDDSLSLTRAPTDEDAKESIVYRKHLGVTIPFASPALLWKTKQTHREKDAVDRLFLRKLLEDRGEWPVE